MASVQLVEDCVQAMLRIEARDFFSGYNAESPRVEILRGLQRVVFWLFGKVMLADVLVSSPNLRASKQAFTLWNTRH